MGLSLLLLHQVLPLQLDLQNHIVLPDTRTQIVRYSVSDATGYVAEVSYEGTAVTAPAVASARLVQEAPKSQALRRPPQQARPQPSRSQNGRPVKRNKNTSNDAFFSRPY